MGKEFELSSIIENQDIDFSVSDALFFEYLDLLPKSIFLDGIEHPMRVLALLLMFDSNKNGAEFGYNLAQSEIFDSFQKEQFVEVLTTLLLQKIHFYQEQIKTHGPHSKLGKFYRRKSKDFEKIMLNVIDNVDFLGNYNIRLEDLIAYRQQDNPHVLGYEIFEEVLQTGEGLVDADDSFFTKITLGAGSMFGSDIF